MADTNPGICGSGGLSNLLYFCSLPSTHTPVTGEPSQVLLRMYGQLLDKNDTKITDSVITMMLSERNLGPKLYGIFPGGRLEEYIPVSIHFPNVSLNVLNLKGGLLMFAISELQIRGTNNIKLIIL